MESAPKWLIETQQLARVYGEGEQAVRALDGMDLKIAAGELVAVMGPSGSGKSTLLNLLGALDTPTGGKVFINGQDITTLRDKDRYRSKTVGFVFQLHNLIPTLTAQENVEVPLIGHSAARERRSRSTELLELVGLKDRMHHLPGQLSGGQRQRVAVARALANRPLLVLADEPTGNLDSAAGRHLLQLIQDLNSTSGTTFLIVTHDPSVARMTRRVIVMADGRVQREDQIGSPLEEDLKMWRYSSLGQQTVSGSPSGLGWSSEQVALLRKLFVNNR